VDEQVAPARERDDHVLAATAYGGDLLADQLGRHLVGRVGPGQAAVGDLDPVETPSREDRLE
jgi:hypothetical protein